MGLAADHRLHSSMESPEEQMLVVLTAVLSQWGQTKIREDTGWGTYY